MRLPSRPVLWGIALYVTLLVLSLWGLLAILHAPVTINVTGAFVSTLAADGVVTAWLTAVYMQGQRLERQQAGFVARAELGPLHERLTDLLALHATTQAQVEAAHARMDDVVSRLTVSVIDSETRITERISGSEETLRDLLLQGRKAG